MLQLFQMDTSETGEARCILYSQTVPKKYYKEHVVSVYYIQDVMNSEYKLSW